MSLFVAVDGGVWCDPPSFRRINRSAHEPQHDDRRGSQCCAMARSIDQRTGGRRGHAEGPGGHVVGLLRSFLLEGLTPVILSTPFWGCGGRLGRTCRPKIEVFSGASTSFNVWPLDNGFLPFWNTCYITRVFFCCSLETKTHKTTVLALLTSAHDFNLYLLHSKLGACSAGLKNIVLADCCERKILF